MGVYGSPQLGQYQPPIAPPPRRGGWGRFWIGVLAGGCGLLVLEAFATCGVFLVGGSAVLNALPSPNAGSQSQSCAPQPCLGHGGLILEISGLNKNVGQGAPFGTPDPAYHRVTFDVTFVDQSGDHEVTSGDVLLLDATGAIRLPSFNAGCDFDWGAVLHPGKTLGPKHLCFDTLGAPSGAITVQWLAHSSSGPAVLTLRL